MLKTEITDRIKGIIVPILTPVDENDRILESKLREQTDFVIDGGVDGILAYGSNGEFYMIEEDDMFRGLDIIISQADGRVPVFFGMGPVSTKTAVKYAKKAVLAGADSVSVLQPPFIRPLESELEYHFGSVADAVPDTPVLLYNNPGRTGYTISSGLVERLVSEHENIIGIKDSSGDMTQTAEFIRVTAGTGFKVFGGKDTLIYGTMAHGGAGAVATTANFVPRLVCSIYRNYMDGDIKASLDAQFRLNPVRLAMDKCSWPVATKDFANIMGRNAGLPYKPNLPTLEGKFLDSVREMLRGLE